MKQQPNKSSKNIVVFGCKHTTLDLIGALIKAQYTIHYCITISPEKGVDQEVAGYLDLRAYLDQWKIPFYQAKNYSLTAEQDKKFLAQLKIDIALVMGWQRLIPDWLLQKISIGAFGMHGSSRPLPHGRGRSPMNWSLITGKKEFYTHLFRYLPGVDDGPVVGVQRFDITAWDDCHTMHFKNLMAMIQLCLKNLPLMFEDKLQTTPQPEGAVSYWPKRSADDGVIFWDSPTEEIFNLIRGVTQPFPGAFSFLRNTKITVWKAIPFEKQIVFDGSPGEIVKVFYDGSCLVKTIDGSLLITQTQGHTFTSDDEGQTLHCQNYQKKDWGKLPD